MIFWRFWTGDARWWGLMHVESGVVLNRPEAQKCESDLELDVIDGMQEEYILIHEAFVIISPSATWLHQCIWILCKSVRCPSPLVSIRPLVASTNTPGVTKRGSSKAVSRTDKASLRLHPSIHTVPAAARPAETVPPCSSEAMPII